MPKNHPPKALMTREKEPLRGPWRNLKERSGVKVLDTMRIRPRER